MCSIRAAKMTHLSQVVFFGIRGTTFLGDIAIDKLSIVPGKCPGKATFSWCNVIFTHIDEAYASSSVSFWQTRQEVGFMNVYCVPHCKCLRPLNAKVIVCGTTTIPYKLTVFKRALHEYILKCPITYSFYCGWLCHYIFLTVFKVFV